MPLDLVKPTPPSDDKRWKVVQATMRRWGNHHDALIETLHTVQETFGYLDNDALVKAALQAAVEARGLQNTCQVKGVGCLGLCSVGPLGG